MTPSKNVCGTAIGRFLVNVALTNDVHCYIRIDYYLLGPTMIDGQRDDHDYDPYLFLVAEISPAQMKDCQGGDYDYEFYIVTTIRLQ